MNEYKNQVGFWGLSKISEAFLRNLTRNSFSVSIQENKNLKYNYLKMEGFTFFETAKDVLDNLFGKKIIFILEDDEIKNVDFVISNYIDILPKGSIIVDFASTSYKNVYYNAKRAFVKEIGYVDCKFISPTKKVFLEPNILVSGRKEDIDVIYEILELCVGNGILKKVGDVAKATYLASIYEIMEMSIVRTLSESINLFDSNNDYFDFDIQDSLDFFKTTKIQDIFETFDDMSKKFNDDEYEFKNLDIRKLIKHDFIATTLKTSLEKNFNVNHLWNGYSCSLSVLCSKLETLDSIPKEEIYFFAYYDLKDKEPKYEFLN